MRRDRKVPLREAIGRLTREDLVELVAAAAESDPRVERRVRELAARGDGIEEQAKAWEARMRGLVPVRGFLDWDEADELGGDIDDALAALRERLDEAPGVVESAVAALLEVEGRLLDRCDDSNGAVGSALRSAVELWGEAWSRLGAEPGELAERVFAEARRNPWGTRDGIVVAFAPALGRPGLERLRDLAREDLAALGPGRGAKESDEEVLGRVGFVALLQDVADALGDVELYVEACRASGSARFLGLEIAKRRLAAGDAAGALATLDGAELRFGDGSRALELRLAALEALGRGDEAQALRWKSFREDLSTALLREHLDRIPDARERREREREALDFGEGFRSAGAALALFVGRGELGRAARLVERRGAELDGRDWPLLRAAALALETEEPAAATLVFRRLVEAVLDAGNSSAYRYALRDFHAAARTWARVQSPEPWLASHGAFVEALRARHGRKWSFWQKLDPESARSTGPRPTLPDEP